MNALTAFLHQVEKNNCIENTTLNLNDLYSEFLPCNYLHHYSKNDMTKLAKALASGNCKSGLTINLTAGFIGTSATKALAEGLKSPNRPANLTLYLTGNKIDDAGLRAIMDALVEGPTTAGVLIILTGDCAASNLDGCEFGNNHITDKGGEFFAARLEKMIANNKCPQNLSFNFKNTKINNQGAEAIFNALESAMKKNPARQTISIELPVRISSFLRERIERDLIALRNRPEQSALIANNLFPQKIIAPTLQGSNTTAYNLRRI